MKVKYHSAMLVATFMLAAACGDDPHTPPPNPNDWGIPAIPRYDDAFEDLYSLDTMKTIRITISETEWNALLGDYDANSRNEIYRKAHFRIEGLTGGSRALADIGFRIRGNFGSRRRPEAGSGPHDPANLLRRAHFKIKFDETFAGDESVYGSPDIVPVPENDGRVLLPGVAGCNLKFNNGDMNFVTEAFSYDLFRRFGVQAPRMAYTRLYIKIGGDSERYVGAYYLLEDIGKEWMQRRYGRNGFLFKCLWQSLGPADLAAQDADGSSSSGKIGIEQPDPLDAAQAAGWNPSTSPYRPSYDLKTKKKSFPEAEDALNALIALLSGNPTKEALEAAIDVQSLLRTQAVNAFLGMWDDYWRNGNNYYLALSPVDGRWVFVPYDYDHTFQFSAGVGDSPPESSFTNWGGTHSPSVAPVLMERVLAIPQFMTDYQRYVGALVSDANEYCTWNAIQSRLAAQQALVGPIASGHDAMDAYPYYADLSGIQAYVAARLTKARAESGGNEPPPQNQIITLTEGQRKSGSVEATGSVWFVLGTATAGTAYQIWVDDSYEGSGSHTGDITVSAYRADRTTAYFTKYDGGYHTPLLVRPTATEPLMLQVQPWHPNFPGTFAIKIISQPSALSLSPGAGFTSITVDSWTYWVAPTSTDLTMTVTAIDPAGLDSVTLTWFRPAWNGSSWIYQRTNLAPLTSEPFTFSFRFDDRVWNVYLNAIATNSLQLVSYSTSMHVLTYAGDYQDAQLSGSQYIFRFRPADYGLDATMTNVFLAGQMNGWGNNTYALHPGRMTNNGSGIYTIVVASNDSCKPGTQYKFNVDMDNNGTRNNNTDWVQSSANPRRRLDSDGNSVVP